MRVVGRRDGAHAGSRLMSRSGSPDCASATAQSADAHCVKNVYSAEKSSMGSVLSVRSIA